MQPTRWWQLNAGVYCIRRGDRAGRHDPARYCNSFSANASTTFTLPAKCYIDLAFFYQSASRVGNFRLDPMHRLDIGVKRRFGERLTLSASVSGVTNSLQTVRVSGAGFERIVEQRMTWNSRCVLIGLSYDFKTGKNFRKRSVEAGAAEEKRRM